MANNRYQLKVDTYMPLDGQWQLVQCGTVFDDNAVVNYSPATVIQLSPGESSGTLASHGKASPVRSVRTR